jgi:RNA polymerase sigma-70 factor (ECF subfamily)
MERDEELVGRVAEGNEPALAELLRRHERPLSRFLFRQTGGRDVDDLYKETWLRVVRNAGRFDPAKRFSTWLFQIAVNLCRDWHRRDVPSPTGEAPETASSADTHRVEAGMDAVRLLAHLPEPQREVLILRYYHDLPESEIAAILDCPKGTVKSRIHNALARLGEIVRAETP